mmetsp:Transcript_13984/g.30412  ORF Transcript_13984/g.30412 Transcript_13984/m.30412 type:complete len:133 (+) Transcript_13984:77-475(+)
MQSPRTILERLQEKTLSPYSLKEDDFEKDTEFVATIRKDDPKQKLGMVHKTTGGRLVIQELKPGGLAMAYNESMQIWPKGSSLREHQLQPADEIVNVNGEKRVKEMKAVLTESNNLFIQIRRLPPELRAIEA